MSVLIKTGDFLYSSNEQLFITEAKLLQQFSHPNIVQMLEISIDTELLYMVLEIMTGGGFLSFLCTHGIHQTQYQLIKFSLDAALGMEYLASQNFVHRNLTARSCLVGNNNEVLKISDFSMCKQTEKGIYTDSDVISSALIRWSAPEVRQCMCGIYSIVQIYIIRASYSFQEYVIVEGECLTLHSPDIENSMEFSLQNSVICRVLCKI